MATGDAMRAWMVLRRVEDYEAAWREHAAAQAALEPGPFPIRVQDAADLEAARFDLLAWEDPRERDGPASPFWVEAHMVKAALAPGVAPLAGVVAEGGRSIEGLRLLDGALVLKIECGAAGIWRMASCPVTAGDSAARVPAEIAVGSGSARRGSFRRGCRVRVPRIADAESGLRATRVG